MNKLIEVSHNEKVHEIHHDIQNCLNVISMGTVLLPDSRHDDVLFDEYCEAISEQRRIASKLLDALLEAACHGCESAMGAGDACDP